MRIGVALIGFSDLACDPSDSGHLRCCGARDRRGDRSDGGLVLGSCARNQKGLVDGRGGLRRHLRGLGWGPPPAASFLEGPFTRWPTRSAPATASIPRPATWLPWQ